MKKNKSQIPNWVAQNHSKSHPEKIMLHQMILPNESQVRGNGHFLVGSHTKVAKAAEAEKAGFRFQPPPMSEKSSVNRC